MRSPPLSPSQRAYTFQRDKFLAGIEGRAARLYEDGYAVEPGERCHEFLITPPGITIPYVVNALRLTCTCCFYRRQIEGEPLTKNGTIVPCKHLQGLKALVRAERRRLQEEELLLSPAYLLAANALGSVAGRTATTRTGGGTRKDFLFPTPAVSALRRAACAL